MFERLTLLKINNIELLKKYTSEMTDDKIIFEKQDSEFIKNNLGLNINKVEVLKGIGIFLKLDNQLIKLIKTNSDVINIDINKLFNTITINHEKDSIFNDNLYLYYENKVTNLYKDNNNEIYFTNKYKIDDIVYPDVDFFKKINSKTSWNSKGNITKFIISYMENDNITINEAFDRLKQNIVLDFRFKITGIDEINKVYKIAHINPDLYNEFSDDKDKTMMLFLKESFYCTEDKLYNKEDIITNVNKHFKLVDYIKKLKDGEE